MFGSWLLAALAVGITALVLWIAFDKLARDYETGLQVLNETVSTRIKRGNHRLWLDQLVNVQPLTWWLRDPVARALHHRLRHFQNEYRNQRWGPVRIIHNWTLIPAVWVDGADDPASYSILE